MNIEDIKEGETYNVRVKVIEKYGNYVDAIYAEYDAIEGIHIPKRRIGILHPISPENGTKNTENAPKYDPNRKFRKGDRVRVAENKGRCLKPFALKIGDVLTVSKDEPNDDTCVIWCKWLDQDFYLDPAYLKLVTPVEELEPYTIRWLDGLDVWQVQNEEKDVIATFFTEHPHAKAAAEAERDRLNAEWRKEQSND